MRTLWIALLLALSALPFAAQESDQVEGELLIGFKSNSALAASAAMARWDMVPLEDLPQIGVRRVRLPRGLTKSRAIRAMRQYSFVRFAEPNYIVRAAFTPNDPQFGAQWNMTITGCPEGWDQTFGSPSIVIAVIDSGIDKNHPEFTGKLVPGWDFINSDSDAHDDHGHGTHVAGIAAAATNNNIGVAGVGFNCRLMPVKVLDNLGNGTTATVANGMNYAVDNGAKVISISLVSNQGSGTMATAVDYAYANNVLVVAAAGNSGNTSHYYPAFYDNALAVAATDSLDQRASISTYGDWVDVAAPGEQIYSTTLGGGYGFKTGSSMATPHVSGLAGLLWTYFGTGVSVDFIRARIESTCDNVGTFVINGRINVDRALHDPVAVPYTPTSFNVLIGSQPTGGVAGLQFSDNSYFQLRSLNAARTSYVRWTTDFATGSDDDLTGLSLRYEGHSSTKVNMNVYAWDFNASNWVYLGASRLGTTDATSNLTFPGNGNAFESSTGVVRLMFNLAMPGSKSVVHRTDQIVLTKLMAP